MALFWFPLNLSELRASLVKTDYSAAKQPFILDLIQTQDWRGEENEGVSLPTFRHSALMSAAFPLDGDTGDAHGKRQAFCPVFQLDGDSVVIADG